MRLAHTGPGASLRVPTFAGLFLDDKLHPDEVCLFRDLLLAELPAFYDDVDSSFPDSILAAANIGRDPHGYFTFVKKIFVGRLGSRARVFTVASYKRGGAVKMVPTVVVPEMRRNGLGTAFRKMVEECILEDQAIRKLYLTVTSGNMRTLLFNLGLGYQIEGALRGQYRSGSTELVLGKMARAGCQADRPQYRKLRPTPPGDFEVREGNVREDELNSYLLPRLHPGFAELDETFTESILSALAQDRQSYAAKGKRLLVARTGGEVCGVTVIVPKRGGSAKLSPLVADHSSTIHSLLDYALELVRAIGRRRLYAIVPQLERDTVEILISRGFHLEAQLREAYRTGIDSLVLGREL